MLDKNFTAVLLEEALSQGGDFAEVFMENSFSGSLVIGERQIKEAASSIDKGVGVRVCKGGELQSYAFTNRLDKDSLIKTARQAAAGINEKKQNIHFNLQENELASPHIILKTQKDISKMQKADLLRDVSERIYAAHPSIIRLNLQS